MSKRQGLGIAAWRGRGALSEDRIEEEQQDAIRIRDLMFSVFLLQVLSCAFCSPAHGLVATTSSRYHTHILAGGKRKVKGEEA